MQFSCESCRARLQIADEKVRGKRVTVRCRRCGAKIALADPLLANSSPTLVERPSSQGPMRVSPRPEPARQPTDDESTRAMDREVLERALEASKADDRSQNGVSDAGKHHLAPPVAPPADVEWFAMIRGKQAGPLTREELIARADDGNVGPRTYLWREGMDAWQRAADVRELYGIFPRVPQAPTRPPPPTPPAAQPRPVPSPIPPVAAAPVEPAVETAKPLDVARWMASEPSPQGAPAKAVPGPLVHYRISPSLPDRGSPMFESTAPSERGPFTVFLGLMALAAAAIVLWIVLAGAPAKRDESRSEPRAQTSPPPPPAPPAAPQEAQPQQESKPPDSPPESKDPGAPAAAPATTGLTAEQVHRKLDENKPALQGCVDEALQRDSSLRVGKIHVTTTIAPSGQVTAARIDQNLVDESPLGACLKRATRKIVFPPFAGSAFDVDIPIVVTAESP
jgi:predicted Zn finger-like uncharacterized protein